MEEDVIRYIPKECEGCVADHYWKDKLIINMKFKNYVICAIVAFIAICGLFYIVPIYNVWASEQEGKAEFVRAEQNRKIKIEEAKANLEAEKLNAEAEIERAKGAAKAIEIENGSLTENYIRYLWVRQQNNLSDKTVIYVPTEAGLPVLEANRMKTQN